MPPTSLSDGLALFARPFDELETGSRFETPERAISEHDIEVFAELTGDRHPQHLDEAWAAAGQFGSRIAHGMLVLSVSVGLLPLDPEQVVALRKVRDAVFKRPVLLGDTVRVKGRIDGLTTIDESTGLVSCAWTVVNGEGNAVARAVADVVWRRSPEDVVPL
jgi:3-hydroxybutyryl-CoA dehydratase